MQRLTVGTSALLIDDDTASAIIWYARMLSDAKRVECLHLAAYDLDERAVEVQTLVGMGIPVMAITAFTSLPDPDNTEVRSRILADSDTLEHPPFAMPSVEVPVHSGLDLI